MACILSIVEAQCRSMGHKYIKPQDSGNRGDVRYAEISDGNGKIRFSALGKFFSFNANHFTLGQLKKAKHIEDLKDDNRICLNIDGYMRGTGSNSCGPGLLEKYRLDEKEFSFEFYII